jgi:hypothetical protein
MSDDQRPSPTPRYGTVLESSAVLAREMGHSHIGVEHLFLAIIGDRAAVPTQVLARIIDLDQLEAGLRQVMASPSYAGEPPAGAVWLPLGELPDLLGALPDCVPPGIRYGFNVVEDQAWIIVDEPGNTTEAVASARALLKRRRQ